MAPMMTLIMPTVDMVAMLLWLLIVTANSNTMEFPLLVAAIFIIFCFWWHDCICYQAELEKKDKTIKVNNIQLAAAGESQVALHAQLQIFRQQLSAVRTELDHYKLRCDALENDLDALQNECEEVSQEIEAVTSRLETDEDNDRNSESNELDVTATSDVEIENDTQQPAVGTDRRLARQKAWQKNNAISKTHGCFYCRYPHGYCANP